MPTPPAHAVARPLPRLDSRLQGRRPGLLELQRLRPVRGVDAPRSHRTPHRRQGGVRPGEDAHHQQRRGQQVHQADVPQGLGAELESVVRRGRMHAPCNLFVSANEYIYRETGGIRINMPSKGIFVAGLVSLAGLSLLQALAAEVPQQAGQQQTPAQQAAQQQSVAQPAAQQRSCWLRDLASPVAKSIFALCEQGSMWNSVGRRRHVEIDRGPTPRVRFEA